MQIYRQRSNHVQIILDPDDEKYLLELLTDRIEDDSPYKNKQLAKMWKNAITRAEKGGKIEEV